MPSRNLWLLSTAELVRQEKSKESKIMQKTKTQRKLEQGMRNLGLTHKDA